MTRCTTEVNVHDLNHDGRLYWNRDEFLRRAAKMNEYAHKLGTKGFRSGVLYRNLEWYGAFEFSYDMSVPNVAHLHPQRGGCCPVLPCAQKTYRTLLQYLAGIRSDADTWIALPG